MQARAGIIGGVIGGIIKLILDQLTFVIGISSVNTAVEFSRLLFRSTQANFAIWIVYLLVTGLVGWLVASLILDVKSYLTVGAAVGVILWVLMNFIFMASGIVTPTWSMGVGSFIVNLITHAVLGVSITYAVWRYTKRAGTTAR
jgi:hypothetical protein